MKSREWDEKLLQEHRSYITDVSAQNAFDVLVEHAIASPSFQCAPGWHGQIRDFAYVDSASEERPYAFIVNRTSLLFYVRRPGLPRVEEGLARLRRHFREVKENTLGEWTIKVRSSEEAGKVNKLLLSANVDSSGVGSRGGVIPSGITREDVLGALQRLDRGEGHLFGTSTKFDLVYEGRRYPPKAVVGLAAIRLAGKPLRPSDFSGGKESQCNRILENLGFRVEGKTRLSELEEWRGAPESAKAVFDAVFEDVSADVRLRWETFLAESIEYAVSGYPDRSVVILEPSFVATTVGMVRCLAIQDQDDLIVLLDKAAAPTNTRWSGGKYEYAPGCEEAYVSRSSGQSAFDAIREAHFRAIDACGRAHAGNGQRRRAHSPGVLRYLETVVGRGLPDPSYAPQAIGRVQHDVGSELEDEAAEKAIQQRTDIGPTEKMRLVKARRGQGIYRQNLEQIEKGCRVTGITDGRYLRASHIKPWCKSDDFEKLDGNNGLLLSPNVDHLFDGGYISFADDGALLVSKDLPEDVLRAMGLKRGIHVGVFKAEQCGYLRWHRKAYGFE